MTQSEVVNKMSMEMALRLGDLSHLKCCKFYINMSLTIGTEYFCRKMEEVVAMNFEGVEIGRYKSVTDASEKLGVVRQGITKVLNGRAHSAGGYLFMKVNDRELIKR